MSNTMHPLVKAVRDLAAEAPDNVYEKPNFCDICCYSEGECTNGSVGCIIGQALVRLGNDVIGLDDLDEGTIASEAINALNIKYISDTEIEWLNRAQSRQDEGHTWSEAVEYADAHA